MSRTALFRLSTLFLVSALALPRAGAQPVAPALREPHFTYLDQPNSEAKEVIAWALSRYSVAGLQVPDLTVSFPSFCDGRSAVYHVGERSIEFCRITRANALHEFAHSWDDTSGAVDREAFLRLRGLKVWFGGLDVRPIEQGCEQLAQIVTWGLTDVDARANLPLPTESVSELTQAFIALTGRQPRSDDPGF